MYEVRVDGLTPANSRELAKVPGWIVQATYGCTYVDSGPAIADQLGAIGWAQQTVQAHMDTVRAQLGGKSSEYSSLIAVRNKLRDAQTPNGHRKVRVSVQCPRCPETFTDVAAADEHRKAHGRADLAQALAADVEESTARSNVIEIRRVDKTKTSIRNLRVPDHLWADCKTIADARGETVSAVLVAALNAYRDNHRELVRSARIAGEQELF